MKSSAPPSTPSNPAVASSKRLVWLILAILAVAAVAGGYYLWRDASKPDPVAQSTPAPSSIAAPTETFTTENLKAYTATPGYNLTFTAPRAWRTTDIESITGLDRYPNFTYNDLGALLRFVPENPERGKLYSAIDPINSLDVLGTASWAKVGDEYDTAAEKQAFLAYLGSLKTTADITSKKCVPLGIGSNVCTQPKVKPVHIQSADRTVSGVAYLTMQTQAVSYDPAVAVELVGTVNGQPMYLRGNFVIYDQLYETLGSQGAKSDMNASDWTSRVEAARKSYLEGKVPADTLAAYERIVNMTKSIRFEKQ